MLLCPPESPGKNTGVSRHFLLQGTPDPGTEPTSLMSPALAGRFFATSDTWGAPSIGEYTSTKSRNPPAPLAGMEAGAVTVEKV